MSTKPKKKTSGEPKPMEKQPGEGPKRPSGRVPEAMVSSRHGTGMVTRLGRGFSFGELSSAGLAPGLASEWGARVDARRRSILDGNVDSLKGWAGHAAQAKKAEGRVKKVEAELAKMEKEVEKEAAEVKEEVVKAEKAVKKEAARAEKAVKAKVEKPKPRPKKKASA